MKLEVIIKAKSHIKLYILSENELKFWGRGKFWESQIWRFYKRWKSYGGFPAQKRNSNFGAEYIYGIRTYKHTPHLIYFIYFQRFSRFTYSKSETFCLFSLLLLTYWISIQKPYFFSRFRFNTFCFRSFNPYNITL